VQSPVPMAVTDHNDGTYGAILATAIAGKASVSVAVNGEMVRALELPALHGPLRAADCAVSLSAEHEQEGAAVCGGECRVMVTAATGGAPRSLTAADHLAMVRASAVRAVSCGNGGGCD
jgi:hypothetical protein